MDDSTTEAQETQRCADCGGSMPKSSVHTECRHCRKCIRPATCGHNHDQWEKQQGE